MSLAENACFVGGEFLLTLKHIFAPSSESSESVFTCAALTSNLSSEQLKYNKNTEKGRAYR